MFVEYGAITCGKPKKPLTIDHVIPRNRGGKDTWENLVAACTKCNTKKGDFLLKNIDMKLLKKPRKPSKIFHLQSNYRFLDQGLI